MLEFQAVQADDLPVKRAAGRCALKIQVQVKMARLVHLRPHDLRIRKARRTGLHDQNSLERWKVWDQGLRTIRLQNHAAPAVNRKWLRAGLFSGWV